MQILENVPLAPYTTFELGGAARYFISVTKRDELGIALDYAQTRNLPFFLLAGGSNMLVADSGFPGVVIKLDLTEHEINASTGLLKASAGCKLMEIIDKALEANLAGMEAMYGIPGTVGGAVRGNAGAFGTEIIDIVKEVEALNIETREIRVFQKQQCDFGYRNSFFKKNKDWIVLSATFVLQPNDLGKAKQKAQEILGLRNERQIQNIKSAGSFFMNPRVPEQIQRTFEKEKGVPVREGRVPAGWLIEKAGFKGFCENGACTGSRSSNYIINNEATAEAVQTLAKKIYIKVANDLGVELEAEVTQVGF